MNQPVAKEKPGEIANLADLQPSPPHTDDELQNLMMSEAESHADTLRTVLKKPRFKDTPLLRTRRENLCMLRSVGKTTTEDLKRIFHTADSRISQMLGTKPSSPVTTDKARAFEAFYGLPYGYLDTPIPQTGETPIDPRALQPAKTSDMTVDAMLAVMSAARAAGLSDKSIAKMTLLVIKDANEHGAVRHSYVSELVALLSD